MRGGELRPYEAGLRAQGYRLVAGIDEVGRGCLAGPVVAAAVIIEPDAALPGVRDSKLLSATRREELDRLIRSVAVAVAVAEISAREIERVNILRATCRAMAAAVARLDPIPDFLLVDGRPVPELLIPHLPIVGGDRHCLSIAAASIVAKVHRDGLMTAHHGRYPLYGFDRHKGYGTAAHRRAIADHGPCPLHRRTFRGVREHLARGDEDGPGTA